MIILKEFRKESWTRRVMNLKFALKKNEKPERISGELVSGP
jgi:hypothetical protein